MALIFPIEILRIYNSMNNCIILCNLLYFVVTFATNNNNPSLNNHITRKFRNKFKNFIVAMALLGDCEILYKYYNEKYFESQLDVNVTPIPSDFIDDIAGRITWRSPINQDEENQTSNVDLSIENRRGFGEDIKLPPMTESDFQIFLIHKLMTGQEASSHHCWNILTDRIKSLSSKAYKFAILHSDKLSWMYFEPFINKLPGSEDGGELTKEQAGYLFSLLASKYKVFTAIPAFKNMNPAQRAKFENDWNAFEYEKVINSLKSRFDRFNLESDPVLELPPGLEQKEGEVPKRLKFVENRPSGPIRPIPSGMPATATSGTPLGQITGQVASRNSGGNKRKSESDDEESDNDSESEDGVDPHPQSKRHKGNSQSKENSPPIMENHFTFYIGGDKVTAAGQKTPPLVESSSPDKKSAVAAAA
eukprot:NODE_1184_length_1881_cov_0.672278.p1 type:complete len:419 gc:universal NODE_1184_length_1881_cov_0.672278:1682-426(-)